MVSRMTICMSVSPCTKPQSLTMSLAESYPCALTRNDGLSRPLMRLRNLVVFGQSKFMTLLRQQKSRSRRLVRITMSRLGKVNVSAVLGTGVGYLGGAINTRER
jgi:hypothetical protein